MLAGQKLFDFHDPHGCDRAAGQSGPGRAAGQCAGARGAPDIDLEAVTEAVRRTALMEEGSSLNGYPAAGIDGVMETSEHAHLTISEDYGQYPGRVAEATSTLQSAGVDGP